MSSLYSLVAVAESAQKIAAGLNEFLDAVPERSTEITGLISECFAISSALRELNNAIRDPLYYHRFELIREDVSIVGQSLDYTFQDVDRRFGGLRTATYHQVWREMDAHFKNESRNTLVTRLEYYRSFLLRLLHLITGIPLDHEEYDILQDKIVRLLQRQEEVLLVDDVVNLSLGDPGITKPKSFERNRPRNPIRDPSPIPLGRRRPYGPQSPVSPGFEYDYFDFPPAAPEVPISPTTTNTFSSQSSSTNSSTNHWVRTLFPQIRSATGFQTKGQVSACFGVNMPDATNQLADDHEKILELPFEQGDHLVRLYLRSRGHRARIFCRTLRPNRSRKQSCLSLTLLCVKREGPNLMLHRLRQSDKSECWAILRFPSYERLVTFFCTFLALRSHDSSNQAKRITDDELGGEKLLFSGVIIDDGYAHRLQMLKDRDSGGIRLQASVMRKELKGTPVWTAFITHLVSSATWMRRADSRTIHLTELQQFIFTTEYSPQLGPGGEYELSFDESDGAKGFYRAIDDLRHR